MAYFNGKVFNPEVFDYYTDTLSPFEKTELINSNAVVVNNKYLTQMKEQTGSFYITTPIKASIGGDPVNYDGQTDIDTTSRKTFAQGRIVLGRAFGWAEEDFNTDITGGEDFLPVAQEVADFWSRQRQRALLAVLEGIFKMSGDLNDDFVATHTYNEPKFSEVTLTDATQKALGDNEGAFSLMIAHSRVIANLKNRGLVEYAKYTDPRGITAEITLPTINGRVILQDDSMPAEFKEEGYVRAEPYTPGAVVVVDSGAKDGQVNKTAVSKDIEDIEAGEYVALMPAGIEYTTYILGDGAVEYTNVGAKVPSEVARDPKTRGGIDILYTRDRVCFAPVGISYTDTSNYSPTNDDLKDGDNWEIAHDGSHTEGYPLKAIPIVQVKTRG